MLLLLMWACAGDGKDVDPDSAEPAAEDTAAVDSDPGHDSDAPDDSAASDSGETGETGEAYVPCPAAAPDSPDWMAPGSYPVGVRIWEDSVFYNGADQQHLLQLFYPAASAGEDAPVDASGGPYPLLVFEHAYGSAFDEYRWLFEALASRGWVIASAEHDANGWNGAGSWWDAHAWLAGETAEVLIGWSEDAGSEWAGSVDVDRIALGGHSHGGGGVMRLAEGWRPMDPDGPREARAVALITVRPDEESYYYNYASTYVGMPPLLNIGGGMDQDGTTAYGQSVAAYEPHGRPGAMHYVEGAEHYSFTDAVSDGYATIPREDAQAVAGPALISFLAAVVEEDAEALATWRGDRAISAYAPSATRAQWHDPEAVTVDAFETDGDVTPQSAAIVGIPGQTYVNGFLGDTLADADAEVVLLRAEIDDLLPAGGSVLFFQDASRGVDTYAQALDAPSLDVTAVSAELDFVNQLAEGGWDLVVATKQDGSSSADSSFDEPLAAWICGGGKAILSDFRVYSTGAAESFACAGASFDGLTNWGRLSSTSALFSGSLDTTNPGWGIYAYGLDALGGASVIYAENELTVSSPHDALTSDVGLSVTPAGMDVFEEIWAVDSGRELSLPTWALELGWSEAGASVSWALDAVDVTAHPVLSLRLLALHDPLAVAGDGALIDMDVEVVDADGIAASWSLSESPQGALRATPVWLDFTGPKSVFETWRVPLRALRDRTPELDLTRIVEVRLVARSGAGAVLVDDLEWSAGEGCW